MTSSFRSILLIAYTTGISTTTLKSSWTNRRMRDVLPTAASPTKQTFVLIRCISGMEGTARFPPGYLKRPPRKSTRGNLFPRGALRDGDATPPSPAPGPGRPGPQKGAVHRAGGSRPRRWNQGELAARPLGGRQHRARVGGPWVRPV